MKRNPALAILFFTIFIDLLGFGIVIPILPDYSRQVGGSDLMVGVVGTSFSLMQFLFTPIWGKLSDRYGRRPIILTSTLITTVAYLFFSQATSLALLIFSRALSGIGSGNISAAQAYISDITPPEKRAQSMGLIGAAFGLGFSIGPLLGGVIKTQLGFAYIGYITASLCLLNFILASFILPESLREKRQEKINWLKTVFPADQYRMQLSAPGKREMFIAWFTFTVAFMMFQITAALLWKDKFGFSEMQITYIFSFIGICTAVVQGGLVGVITRKFGERRLLPAGAVVFTVGLAGISFVPKEWFIPAELLLLLLMALGNGMIGPSGLSIVSQMTGRHEQGQTLGLLQSMGSLGRVAGPMMGGMLYAVNWHAPYLAAVAIMAVTFLLVLNVSRNFERYKMPADVPVNQ